MTLRWERHSTGKILSLVTTCLTSAGGGIESGNYEEDLEGQFESLNNMEEGSPPGAL